MDSIDKESKLKEIKNNDIGIFRIHFGENDFNEIDEEEVDSKKQSITIKNKKKPFLSSPAITMARNLRELLLNIDKLPDQQSFTMNPTKFTIIESYVQFLLNKLKSSSTKEAFVEELRCNNDNFLEIGLPPNNENLKDNFEITSEKEENSLRENILKQVYESAEYESAEYYYIDEESPRYYPDNDNPDNEESPRYYHREIFWGADLRRISEIISAQILYPGAKHQRKNPIKNCADFINNKVLRRFLLLNSAHILQNKNH
ncbi:hypothetical protein RhiirA1_504059 [Rhizophagus irregularis]|uniref:Uncharacterized protein n=1 Tax=Rhizophagus irregularis TaxID=588596 RepID=A0A2N0QW06_9GLOM|nr:hypothetical protein RhiirA1_504059 [Rhizophagus irregularis]